MEMQTNPEQEDFSKLESFGESLLRLRKEAIDARISSGIERIWLEDEEHYEGIDELNRGQERSAWASKPPGRADPSRYQNRSIVFPNITRPYVDAASAKIGDTLLPTDDRAWSLSPTPIPELMQIAEGVLPEPVQQGMEQIGVPQQTQEEVAQIEAQEAAKQIKDAKDRARKAEKRIEDWHVEGLFHAEMRRVIDDACKVGSGVLKGPIPAVKRQDAYY
jgi:hypothetical protein